MHLWICFAKDFISRQFVSVEKTCPLPPVSALPNGHLDACNNKVMCCCFALSLDDMSVKKMKNEYFSSLLPLLQMITSDKIIEEK